MASEPTSRRRTVLDPWRRALREPLAVQLRRHASAEELAHDYDTLLADWVSVGRQEADAAAAVVEPLIVDLRARARSIGARQGRLLALVWSMPVALVLVLVAVAILVGVPA